MLRSHWFSPRLVIIVLHDYLFGHNSKVIVDRFENNCTLFFFFEALKVKKVKITVLKHLLAFEETVDMIGTIGTIN